MRKIVSAASLASIFLFFFLTSVTFVDTSTTHQWIWTASDFLFKCSDSGEIISFVDDFYSDNVEITGSYWRWNNILINNGDTELSSFGVGVENANATIHYLNTGGIGKIVLSAPNETISYLLLIYPINSHTTIRVDATEISNTQYFSNLTKWTGAPPPAVYVNETLKHVRIKAEHASDVTVLFHWSKAQEPIGPSNGTTDETDETDENGEWNLPETKFPLIKYVAIGLIIFVVFVMIIAFSQVERKYG